MIVHRCAGLCLNYISILLLQMCEDRSPSMRPGEGDSSDSDVDGSDSGGISDVELGQRINGYGAVSGKSCFGVTVVILISCIYFLF